MLCSQCEHRGLVFVHSHDPQQKLGEVFYDRDPSWQYELVSGVLNDVLAEISGNLLMKPFLTRLLHACR